LVDDIVIDLMRLEEDYLDHMARRSDYSRKLNEAKAVCAE
jgi:hypothetical protein